MSASQSPPTLKEEQYVLIGIMLSLVTYGVGFLIFIQCVIALRRPPTAYPTTPRKLILVYTCFMFLFGTLCIIINASLKVLAYTTHINYPGGPVAWVYENYSSAAAFASDIFSVLTVWGADGLLLYRCTIIYRHSLVAVRLLLLLPAILFVAEIVYGLLVIIQVSNVARTIWNSINLGLPYYAICAACNVTITLTIAAPLLIQRRRLAKALGGNKEYSRPYTSAVAILVESSALYTVVAVAFIVFYALNDPISHIFLPALCQIQVIAPFLIILRVATKRAWTSTTGNDIVNATTNQATEIRFTGMDNTRRDRLSIEHGEMHSRTGTRHAIVENSVSGALGFDLDSISIGP